jgi:nitroreductase
MALAKANNPSTLAVLDAIYQRRAHRSYTARMVSKETVQALLDAAVQAPSAMNHQPWAFLVIQNKNLLKRISDAAKSRIMASAAWAKDLEHKHIPLDDPQFDIFYGASTLIVICTTEAEGFCPEGDCYLAGQNLMLAAQALGLGTCPIGFARDILQTEEFRQELSIPGGHRPALPIIVGYVAAAAAPPHREAPKLIGWLQ